MFRFRYGDPVTLFSTIGCVVKPTAHSQVPVLHNTFPIALKRSITVEGVFVESTPSGNASAIYSLKESLKVPRQACGVEWFDGAIWNQTNHWLPVDSTLIEGPIVESFSCPQSELELIVECPFSITLSAVYSNTYEGRNYVEYNEQVSINGDGGPLTVLAPRATLKSQYQQIRPYTDVTVTQRGTVTCRYGLATVPAPLILIPMAKDSLSSSLVRSYKQQGTSILLSQSAYSYTFRLPELIGTISPGFLI